MKRVISILLCFMLLFSFGAYAEDPNIIKEAADEDIRDQIVEEARKWLGTKYALVDGSDGPGEENYVDCSGFVMQVYKCFGYDTGRTVSDQMKKGYFIDCSYENYENLLPGDVLIMNDAGHVGIYTGDGNVIHASFSKQQIVEVPVWESGGISHGARRYFPTGEDIIKSEEQKENEESSDASAEEAEKDTEEKDNTIILTIDERKAMVFGEIKENDVPPVIRDGKTMLPARFVAEALGAEIFYNEEEKQIEIYKGDRDIVIKAGAGYAEVTDWSFEIAECEIKDMGAEVFIENGRTYMPVRFIAEELGAEVFWDGDLRNVIITPGGEA